MSRLSPQDVDRVSTALMALYGCLELRELPRAILALLTELVSADCASYNEFDRSRPKQVVAFTQPMMPEIMARVSAFEAHIAEHPHISHYRKTGDGRPYRTTDLLTQRQFQRLGIYKKFFEPVGIRFQIGGFFSGTPGLEIGLALNRSKSDFLERDRDILALVYPHLVQAYQNAAAFSQTQRKTQVLSEALEATNQALIVLTAAGRVAWLTPHAVQLLERYFPGAMRDPNHLPAASILGVSPRTIHKHVEHILAKLGVENRSAALPRRAGVEMIAAPISAD
jgi:Bacterial regulatory proteins, luxR family